MLANCLRKACKMKQLDIFPNFVTLYVVIWSREIHSDSVFYSTIIYRVDWRIYRYNLLNFIMCNYLVKFDVIRCHQISSISHNLCYWVNTPNCFDEVNKMPFFQSFRGIRLINHLSFYWFLLRIQSIIWSQTHTDRNSRWGGWANQQLLATMLLHISKNESIAIFYPKKIP